MLLMDLGGRNIYILGFLRSHHLIGSSYLFKNRKKPLVLKHIYIKTIHQILMRGEKNHGMAR
jgi:hypothetical protein